MSQQSGQFRQSLPASRQMMSALNPPLTRAGVGNGRMTGSSLERLYTRRASSDNRGQETQHPHPGDIHNKVSLQAVTHFKHSHNSKNHPGPHPQIHTPPLPSKPSTVPPHLHPGAANLRPISTPPTSPPSAPEQVTSPTVSLLLRKVMPPPRAQAPSINNVCNKWQDRRECLVVDNLARMRTRRLISPRHLVRTSFLRWEE